MNKLNQYRHSSLCNLKCLPQGSEDIYSHQDDHNIEHQYVRGKKVEEQIKGFMSGMERICVGLSRYKNGLLEQLGRIKKQIQVFQGQIENMVYKFLESIHVDIIEEESSVKIARAINNFSFQNITCSEMAKILDLTSPSYSKYLGAKMEQKVSKMQKECQIFFQKFAKNTFKLQKLQLVNIKQIEMLHIVELQESTILKNDNSNEISINSLSDFNLLSFVDKGDEKAKKNDKKKQIDNEDEIIEQSDEQTYFTSHNKNTKDNATKKPQNKQTKDEKKQVEQNQSSWDSQLQQQNIQPQQYKFIQPAQYHQDEDRDYNFMKMDEVDEIVNTVKDFSQDRFSIRVQVVRILYYFDIKSYLKVKFIAGDQTGVAVFMTNYQKGLKAGDQLVMYDCQLIQFKRSVQIKNDCSFKILPQQTHKLKANIKGIFLSQFIEEGIHYAMNDKKCSLIRNIAHQVRRKNAFNIDRMIVKISFILNEWNSHIFCQVGDSSGLMLAYIKKPVNQKLNEGDVLNIKKVIGKKGKDPSGLIEEQILYLDAIGEKALIARYLSEFLQISQNVMSL